MAVEGLCTRGSNDNNQSAPKFRSLFDLPADFFDSSRILHGGRVTSSSQFASVKSPIDPFESHVDARSEALNEDEKKIRTIVPRWSCNTCKAEFESLQDQRTHFKSDIHRLNVKLSFAGKEIVKEEDFDDLMPVSSFEDFDISSISGSEDEAEEGLIHDMHHGGAVERVKQKIYIRLQTGETVSIWKCLLLAKSESHLFENHKLIHVEKDGHMSCLSEDEIIGRLKCLIHEPRDNTRLRILLLAIGGHFAGCVFDGNSVVAHKTFHRYVVRAKAGKKQSSKDASGKAANSAGSSLRRYNELALKKEIQELLSTWRTYFDESSFVFIHAPSNNKQLLFDGDKPYFSHQHCIVQHVPLNVQRPTLKEAKRIYYELTNMTYEGDDKEYTPGIIEGSPLSSCSLSNDNLESNKEQLADGLEHGEIIKASSGLKSCDAISTSSDSENEVIGTSTPLHEASISGNSQKVLELLEEGLDPCIKDERGRTPYKLATEKEVRNTFRRFMALNLNKWDWHAAKVPSPLTKEMEESQAAKQAEKDAKRKARSKELKKLRKAKEKQAQAQATVLRQNDPVNLQATVSRTRGVAPVSVLKGPQSSIGGTHLSKEEELKRAQAEEREKRAAAAERRIAAAAPLKAQQATTTVAPSSSDPKSSATSDIICSCCKSSLAGKVPFHRYHYKYCSTSCMHVHKDILEDG